MKRDKRILLLRIYDFILSLGAVYIGIMMINSKGVFAEFPSEWIGKLPFDNWAYIGAIAILVFGLGNFISVIFSFWQSKTKALKMSVLMSVLLLICIMAQRYILGEWYLATSQLLISGILQIILCGAAFWGYKSKLPE